MAGAGGAGGGWTGDRFRVADAVRANGDEDHLAPRGVPPVHVPVYTVVPDAAYGISRRFNTNTASAATSHGVITYNEANNQRIHAFVRGANGRLHVNFWDGSQWHWADQGMP